MSTTQLALTIAIASLAGFAIALIGFRRRHAVAAGVVLLSSLATLVASCWLLATESPEAQVIGARWFTIGDVSLDFGLLLDGKTLVMGAVVALITFLIQVYSLAYMKDDPGKGRFFAFLAFFEWSMLLFVYASSLLQTFIFWELVGLASFLLIGFWYEKPSAVAAAKKAFLMTRIGDVGLFIGLILLFMATGTLDIPAILGIFGPEGTPADIDPQRIELIATLLFVGVIGKSAQFPLHTWLPDAMEGPTPVSALLHSATMVAAGVFLVARLHPLFLDAPSTMLLITIIATLTALLASTMAMVATDMKRILAFSSVSQLAFMLIGLGAGSLFAGFFHLTTHAFFKALLFLCAGSYIHALGTNDVIAMGRAGARRMPITTLGLVAGGAALAGIPMLSGFFSKEQIIGALHGPDHSIFRVCTLVAAFLTAYYTSRMVFLIVAPNPDSKATPDEPAGAQHAHGPSEPWAIRGPLLVLSALAIGAGYFGDRLAGMLEIGHVHHPTVMEMAPAAAIALAGVALAWFEFARRGSSQLGFVARVPAAWGLFRNRWYIDAIYNATIVRLSVGVARACFVTETRALDGAADGVAQGTAEMGGAVARGHAGRLQVYVGVAAALIGGAALYLGLR